MAHFFSEHKMINFIQIGANVGNTDTDPMWPIVREKNWKGIFIEPIPESFNTLVDNYKDVDGCIFENIAICDYDGEATIFRMESDPTSECASLVAGHFKGRNDFSVSIECMTLNSLATKHDLLDKPFDLLQIDAEGMDYSILMSTDFSHILPRQIRYESVHMSKQDRSVLLKHMHEKFGYKEITDEYDILDKKYDTLLDKTPSNAD